MTDDFDVTLYYCTNCFVVHAWPNQDEETIEENCMAGCEDYQIMQKVGGSAE